METNLLEETMVAITQSDHTESDVVWVGSRDGQYSMPWTEAVAILNVAYDSGYGSQDIASDLVVVFIDGSWLERREYDGSEGWDFCKTPVPTASPKSFSSVNGGAWDSLSELNPS